MKSEATSSVGARYRGPACNIVEARRWDAFLHHLKAYIDEQGSAAPPSRYVATDGYHLGHRAGFYRTARRLGHLPIERIMTLQSLNGWKW